MILINDFPSYLISVKPNLCSFNGKIYFLCSGYYRFPATIVEIFGLKKLLEACLWFDLL